MVLRFVLVSLVASLGFELPETADLSRWIDAGRFWVSAQEGSSKIVGDEVIEVVEEEDEPAAPERRAELAESVRREGDSASIEVVDLEASAEAIEVVEAEEVTAEDVVFEAIVGEMAESFSADALNGFAPEAVELTQVVPKIGVEAAALTVADEGEDRDRAVVAVEVAAGSSRAERLGVAVQLTGQAIHAWMGVFRQGTPLVTVR